MSFILIHRSGSLRGRRDEFNADTVLLGRKRDNDVIFAEEVVSGHHAEIRRVKGGYQLRDLHSSNGIFVNHGRIESIILRNQDVVQIGKKGPEFEFRLVEERESDLPVLIPVSGDWKSGNAPVKLMHRSVSLGRASQNDVVLGQNRNSGVSRQHCRIEIHGDECRIEDLKSSNGTFVNDRGVRACILKNGDRVRLGSRGPEFEFRWDQPSAELHHRRSEDSEQILEKLDRAAKGGRIGEQTQHYLKVAKQYSKKRRRPLLAVLVILIIIILTGVNYTAYLKHRLDERPKIIESFYEARRIQSDLLSGKIPSMNREGERQRRRELMDRYSKYLEEEVPWYARKKSDQEKAILKMARRLGEADLLMPPEFVTEVGRYVDQWRSTPRLQRAMKNARDRRLIGFIKGELRKRDLPEEFVFIPLVESDFQSENCVNPDNFPDPERLRKLGIAKGLWMFIPSTAVDYGLRIGPAANESRFDPVDERHDPVKSTQAAVHYLSDLYITKARASGLLVLACYNYGSTRINKTLDGLADDPRIRNFWYFYQRGLIPEETRDYVMKIFTAALICENHQLFGFPDYLRYDSRIDSAYNICIGTGHRPETELMATDGELR